MNKSILFMAAICITHTSFSNEEASQPATRISKIKVALIECAEKMKVEAIKKYEEKLIEEGHAAVEALKKNKNNLKYRYIISQLEDNCYQPQTWGGIFGWGTAKPDIERIDIKKGKFRNCAECQLALEFARKYHDLDNNEKLNETEKDSKRSKLDRQMCDFILYDLKKDIERIFNNF